MPNSFPTITNNPSGFSLTPTQISGNQMVGVNNVQSLPNVLNPKALNQPSANGYSSIPTNPKYTPFTDYAPQVKPTALPPQTIDVPSSSSGNTVSNAGKVLGILGAVLSAPQVAEDFGSGLGFLFNLPQIIKNASERERLDNLLKQREAQLADNARINNTPIPNAPPFTGGQMFVNYFIGITFQFSMNGGATWIDNTDNWLIAGKVLGCIFTTSGGGGYAVQRIDANGIVSTPIQITISNGWLLRDPFISSLSRTDGQPDIGGNLAPTTPTAQAAPPPYPSRDNWEYGDIDLKVGNGFNPFMGADAGSVKPFNNEAQPDIASPDTSNNPNIGKNPNGFPNIPSTSPSASPSPSSATPSNPSPQTASPSKGAVGGFTRIWATQTPATQTYASGMTNEMYANGTTPNTPTFNPVQQQSTPLYNKGSQTTPNQPVTSPTNQPLNSTPNTPVTPNQPTTTDNNTAQMLVNLLGLTGLVTALKLGSDAFVNASLPKIENINNNTSPQAQQTNAKQGVCDAMQPNQCGFEGVKQATTEATNPIKDQAVANAGLIGNVLSAIASLGSTIATLFSNVVGKVDKIKDFLDLNAKVESVKSTITLALTLHNALMLSQNLGTTLGTILDNVLQTFGLTFKTTEGTQISTSEYLGSTVQNFIINIIGAENYANLSEALATANRIYQSGMNILSTVQSILDSAASVAQATGINVAKIGNSLRDDGVVSPKAYTHMDDTPLGNRPTTLSRFEQLTTTISDFDTKAQNLVTITAAPIQIKDAVKQSKDDIKAFNDARDGSSQTNLDAKQAKLDQIKTLKAVTEATITKRDDDT